MQHRPLAMPLRYLRTGYDRSSTSDRREAARRTSGPRGSGPSSAARAPPWNRPSSGARTTCWPWRESVSGWRHRGRCVDRRAEVGSAVSASRSARGERRRAPDRPPPAARPAAPGRAVRRRSPSAAVESGGQRAAAEHRRRHGSARRLARLRARPRSRAGRDPSQGWAASASPRSSRSRCWSAARARFFTDGIGPAALHRPARGVGPLSDLVARGDEGPHGELEVGVGGAAEICVRIRAVPSGTTGYENATAKTPCLTRAAESRAAAEASPTITGTIGWSPGSTSNPSPSCAPGTSGVLPEAPAQVVGALDQVERPQARADDHGGHAVREEVRAR